MRVSSVFGTGLNSTTGSYAGLLGATAAGWNGVTPTVGKEFTYLDKAFIQFAGITMGRAQSMFDFYGDAFNYEALRGSNQNVWELAYTATFGGGFSATLSIEDTMSHRGNVSTVTNSAGWGQPAGTVIGAVPQAGRIPDIIANLRVDQPWGSAQLAGALHPVRGALYASNLSPSFPAVSSSQIGYAISGGVMFKLDSLSPGDQLWLQAIYAKGAFGYVSGSNMAFTGSPNATSNYGVGVNRQSNGYGWNLGADSDCVITYGGSCDMQQALAVTAALKHYWSPTVSSGFGGSFMRVTYSGNSLTPINWVTGVANGGITNYTEGRVFANLVWTPVKGFDIGGEVMWIRGVTSRPFGLANDLTLVASGLPAWKSVNDAYYGKIRMIRAF
jgi:hypothetical protein